MENTRNIKRILVIVVSFILLWSPSSAVAQQLLMNGPVTTLRLPKAGAKIGPGGVDLPHAKPMPLPRTSLPPSLLEADSKDGPAVDQLFGPPGFSPGSGGSGKQSPLSLAPIQQLPQDTPSAQELDGLNALGLWQPTPQEFGTAKQPFTTSQANADQDDTFAHYPFRASGKLFFKIGSDTFVCSASLVKRGVVVTAAHCVANFGKSQLYSNWVYVPAYHNGLMPFGVWTASSVKVLTSYLTGRDRCAQKGIICQDDVAVILLNPQNGSFAGDATGWFSYGFNGYGFNGRKQALITQLGYPVALDNGQIMERTDSQAFTDRRKSNNINIGSLMTGGSSGGPWVINLGVAPTFSGTTSGTFPDHNVVVGVTSWGYVNPAVKQQGASPFTSANIGALVGAACAENPAACQ